MKYKAAIKYKILNQFTHLGIFFIWWLSFGFFLPIIASVFFGSDNRIGQHQSIFFPILIFSFVISTMDGSTDFKFFIQNGLSRLNIFLVNLTSTIIVSITSAIIVYFISKISLYKLDFSLIILDKNLYYSDNALLNVVLIGAITLLICTLGIITGVINDMFTRNEKIVILVSIMGISAIIILLLKNMPTEKLTNYLNYILGYSEKTGFYSLSLIITLSTMSTLIFLIIFILTKFRGVRSL